MKSTILLLALAAVIFSSCSSAYKTGQTPDDVYFSPAPKGAEYVETEKKEDKNYKGSDEYYEDRYLRMRVQNRYQWSALDDYYFNNPYAYNYYGSYYNSISWSSPYNSYWMWNNYYNPYCGGSVIIVKNPGRYNVPPARPIAFSLNSYTNNSNRTPARRSLNNNYSTNGSRYNNSNNSLSNSVRKVFTNSNSNNNSNYYNSNNNSSTPSRSYNPSSNTGSRSSSSPSSNSNSGGGGGGGRTRTGR